MILEPSKHLNFDDEARREAIADDGFDETARMIEGKAKKRKALPPDSGRRDQKGRQKP
jgi:hypothetical protein